MTLLARVLLILLACSAAIARAQPVDKDSGAALRIALVTAAPGKVYWQRFGHNAILVENQVTGEARLYNFGMFDFEQKNFLLNFARGKMLYRLAAFAPEDDLANYKYDDRSVWIQELDLVPDARYAVAEMLAQNALPENAEYRYDYFMVNCSTRVRDVLDAALEGRLQESTRARARGESFRSLALAYARPEPWLALGIDVGLGPAADRRISYWDEAFLPLRLRELVREQQVPDANGVLRPLVSREWTAYAGKLDDRVPEQPRWFTPFAVLGAAFALGIAAALRARSAALRRVGATLASLSALLLGLGGLVLTGLWTLTDHAIAYANLNLVLFNPLCLLLVRPLWRLHASAAVISAAARAISALVLLIALAGLTYTVLPGVQQANAAWFALLLPLLCVFAWRFWIVDRAAT